MSYVKGDKVQYRTIMSGTVLGVVLGMKRDNLGEYVEWRITSRKNVHYPFGLIEHTSPNPWFKLR